jgi:S-(hydroxymethyl)glutathione dehydrogenase/alcohol dehydrogenase
VVPVPSDLPLDCAALLACGVITGLGAVVNTAQIPVGSSVVVIGTGGVGLNAIQGAVLSGAATIIAVDRLDSKLQAARAFGATHTVNVDERDAADAVRQLTSKRGAEYVFVTVGSTAAVAQGLRMIGKLGTLVIVGIPEQDATIPLTVDAMVFKGSRIIGSNMGSTRLSVDVPQLVELYRQGRLKLDELITARYPLERINEAIESMERGEALRNVITFV